MRVIYTSDTNKRYIRKVDESRFVLEVESIFVCEQKFDVNFIPRRSVTSLDWFDSLDVNFALHSTSIYFD